MPIMDAEKDYPELNEGIDTDNYNLEVEVV